MRRREVAELGAYPRFLLVEHTALYRPLYFSRPTLPIPRRRPLPYRTSPGIPPVYHAEGLLGYAGAPVKMPSRRKRNLNVVKKPFKLSQKRRSARNSCQQGGNFRKTPFQANKKAQKRKKEAQRPRPRSLDLGDEARALHALWRAGPVVTNAKIVQKDKNEVRSEGRVDLADEVRALHALWRAGPASAWTNVTVGHTKLESHLDLGMPSEVSQAEHVNTPKEKRKRKKKKKARRTTLIEDNKAVQMASTLYYVKPVTSCSGKSVGFLAEEAASTSSTRRLSVSMMRKSVVHCEMPMELQKDACKQVMDLSSSDDGESELKKLTPDEAKEEFYMLTELQKNACKHVEEFLSTVDGGIGLEKLTPDEEKAREEEGFLFFFNLFENNSWLRSLYIGQGNGGTLDCLICHGIGESKSFDKVLSLVMHATSRVKRRPEHRGYGRAVAMILGWNSNGSSVHK